MEQRGIRGAVVVEDLPEDIRAATQHLLEEITKANPGLKASDIASVLFTVTRDVTAMNPARAAREYGWTAVPLMCAQEASMRESLAGCIRVLVLWNTEKSQDEINHIYVGEAAGLRPDLSSSARQRIKP